MHEKTILKKYSDLEIIDALAPLLTQRRITKINEIISKRLSSVSIALESPYDVHNALATIRTAEALGIYQCHIIDAYFEKKKGKRTTMGATYWAEINRHKNTQEFLNQPKPYLVGLTPSGMATLDDVPLDRPVQFIFGNEQSGLSNSMIEACDQTVSLSMYGMVESYNLSVSFGITLYQYVERKRQSLFQKLDITPNEVTRLKSLYYLRTVGIRVSDQVLSRVYEPSLR